MGFDPLRGILLKLVFTFLKGSILVARKPFSEDKEVEAKSATLDRRYLARTSSGHEPRMRRKAKKKEAIVLEEHDASSGSMRLPQEA
ncbi:hypothetical protein CTI12_AA155520 [Artemisia annua]|uniref:Uncharacterized protein n=1 Tax=Artemisia annua TaxID=35608 RepID=A0A2U1PGH1_ARTAN|nr:hypothetical protein CTI12_AA155520 [Artemisia annua]